MREYQSFGAGVNSVALTEVLDGAPERVFADTGCEMPETYDYLNYYTKTRPVTILSSPVQGFSNLEEYCRHYKTAPMRHFRWCTDKFKGKRLDAYYKSSEKVTVYMGIAYDEKHRVKIWERGNILYKYPLVDEKITREKCKEIIVNAGLNMPIKSGCYFCPFQRKDKWIELLKTHPKLYERAIEIDELSPKIRLYDKGLRNLKGRIDAGLEQKTLFEKDEEGWECQFCMVQYSEEERKRNEC